MKNAESAGIAAVRGYFEALTTALGLLVAVPAVWLFNYFTGKVDGFVVEMDNSAGIGRYFIKNRTKQVEAIVTFDTALQLAMFVSREPIYRAWRSVSHGNVRWRRGARRKSEITLRRWSTSLVLG
jgi:hypothetical protein